MSRKVLCTLYNVHICVQYIKHMKHLYLYVHCNMCRHEYKLLTNDEHCIVFVLYILVNLSQKITHCQKYRKLVKQGSDKFLIK
jgi:hypothetical protein